PPGNAAFWVGGMGGPGTSLPYGIRRQSTSFLGNSTVDSNLSTVPGYRAGKILNWSFLLDDMTFLSDGPNAGLPCPPAGVVQREDRYSWAYFMRVPDVTNLTLVDMNIVVYSGRTPAIAATGAMQGEQTFVAVFDTSLNAVRLTWPAGSPPPNLK